MNDVIQLAQDVSTTASGASQDVHGRLALWLADVSTEAAVTALDCLETPDDPAGREPSSE
jgi:hypothetical protein